MSVNRVEEKELIVGNSPFGLVDKNAKFARWDTRKALRKTGFRRAWVSRTAELFEGNTNDELLESTRRFYSAIADFEANGLTSTPFS